MRGSQFALVRLYSEPLDPHFSTISERNMNALQMQQLQKMFMNSMAQQQPSENQLLEILDKAKKTAKSEQNQPPIPLEYTPPMEMTMQMTMSRLDADRREVETRRDLHEVRTTYVGQKIEYCTLPLKELKPGKDEICDIFKLAHVL
jgi:hypothetical protein